MLLTSHSDAIMTAVYIVPIIVGWVALFALWWFVFRERKPKDGDPRT